MPLFDFSKIKRSQPKQASIPKLVIGINQVDNLADAEHPWVDEINQPSVELEEVIQQRAEDIIKKLSQGAHSASRDQIEYFSALRAYRLPLVINKIVQCSGIITTFKPKDINDKDCAIGMSEENREEIGEMIEASRAKYKSVNMDDFLAKIMEALSPEEGKEFQKLYKEKKEKPVRVGILGQSGVGKTTTVNNLFGAKFKTSRTVEGTKDAQYKDFQLEDGSVITIVDLPGYGRSLDKDEKYKEIYIRELRNCDVILLVIQANDKAIADDQYMIQCLYEWSKEGLLTANDQYYGQDTDKDIFESEKEEAVVEKNEQSTQETTPTPSGEKVKDMSTLTEIRKICQKRMAELEIESEEYQVLENILNLIKK